MTTQKQGLSPRVRGNPRMGYGNGRWARSIPACAGEPRSKDRIRVPTEVYPRVCGGLSPRVRGNLFNRRAGSLHKGSIPACAGEPMVAVCSRPAFKVYPRVCGEPS